MRLKELNKTTSRWLKEGMDPESLLEVEVMYHEEMDCTAVIVSIGGNVMDVAMIEGDDTPEDYLEQMDVLVSEMLDGDPDISSLFVCQYMATRRL